MVKSKIPADIDEIKPFRKVIIDLLGLGYLVHRIHAYGEEDCDDAMRRLNVISEKIGRKISLTAYFTTCWASTVANNPIMQAYRMRNKIIKFKDVDCVVNVEKDIEGKKTPTSYIVRAAQNKSVIEISDEIREAQTTKSDSAVSSTKKSNQSKARMITRLPGFIRRIILKHMTKNPYLKKELFGTVGLSSIGMFTLGGGSAISISVHASTFIVGGVGKKPWVVEENGKSEIKIRNVVSAFISMDHDLVDGGPAARAIAELRTKVRTCYGLDEIEKELGIQ